ncbi:MAG TPA: hypothetical protein VIF34_11340 [Methylocystis sp.]
MLGVVDRRRRVRVHFAARIFGFDRTGPDLKAEIEKTLEGLLKRGEIEEEEGKLRRRAAAS